MTVLDASAVLALVQGDPGAEVVVEALPGSSIGAADLAEVVGKLTDAGADGGRVRDLLEEAGVVVEPLTAGDAELAGALRSVDGGRALSLGDRCCIALALRTPDVEVLTADRAWVELDLPVIVRVLR